VSPGRTPFVFTTFSMTLLATGYRLDDRGIGVRIPVGSRIFSSLRRPDRLWDPPNLLYLRVPVFFSQTLVQNWTHLVTPIVFKITPRHGPRRNTLFPTVRLLLCLTCLPSPCLEISLVYSSISWSSRSNGSTRYNIFFRPFPFMSSVTIRRVIFVTVRTSNVLSL
jgi:hypothetical protein